jgi:hypothetical protein
MITFIGLFDIVCDCTLQFSIIHKHACAHTHAHNSVHSHIFTAVAWEQLLMANIPLPLGSRTAPGLSYQLLTATAYNI